MRSATSIAIVFANLAIAQSPTFPTQLEKATIWFEEGHSPDGVVVSISPIKKSGEGVYDKLFPTFCPTAWCIKYEMYRFGRIEGYLSKSATIRLQVDIGGICARKPNQWSAVTEDNVDKDAKSGGFHLEEAEGCTIEMAKVTLLSAQADGKFFARKEGPSLDFTRELNAIQARRDADDARQRQLGAQQRQREAEAAVKLADERRKARESCAQIYKGTIDRKVSDLTVREEQQVRACQGLNLYPPR